jgi:hypothetical protein
MLLFFNIIKFNLPDNCDVLMPAMSPAAIFSVSSLYVSWSLSNAATTPFKSSYVGRYSLSCFIFSLNSEQEMKMNIPTIQTVYWWFGLIYGV